MIPNETTHIAVDTALLQQLQSNKDYDYNSSLRSTQPSYKLQDPKLNDPNMNGPSLDAGTVLTIVCAIVGAVIIALMWKNRNSLFAIKKHGDGNTTGDDEDSIYGVDFDTEIAEAMAQSNHNRATRLIYLKTLRWLNDNNVIKWQPGFTPWQYSRQIALAEFDHMTDKFTRVRYGKFNMDADTVQHMLEWSKQVIAHHKQCHAQQLEQQADDGLQPGGGGPLS